MTPHFTDDTARGLAGILNEFHDRDLMMTLPPNVPATYIFLFVVLALFALPFAISFISSRREAKRRKGNQSVEARSYGTEVNEAPVRAARQRGVRVQPSKGSFEVSRRDNELGLIATATLIHALDHERESGTASPACEHNDYMSVQVDHSYICESGSNADTGYGNDQNY